MLISGELKLGLLSAWIRYDVAPLTLPQPKVGVLSPVVLPFDGEESAGADGVHKMVKLQVDDQDPSPQELEACTRQ